MKKSSIITLIDAINREGLTNNYWSIIEDVDTRSYFGTTECKVLSGSWLAIYYDSPQDEYSFIKDCGVVPNYRMTIEEYNEIIELYKLS